MKNIAIITARGGSKRIPRKNIRDFCGHPIMYYSIKAALESKIFDEVMVSTDDQEIASIATNCGAKVPFLRSAATANDFATTEDVLKEVILQYKSLGLEFSYGCCLYPTAPFITAQKLKQCFNDMLSNNCDTALTVVRYSFPPQRAFVIPNGRVSYQYPEYANMRSQDLEAIYHDCGQFYFFNMRAFLQSHLLIDDNTYPFIVSEEEVQDIDILSDWKIAEMKYKLMQEN